MYLLADTIGLSQIHLVDLGWYANFLVIKEHSDGKEAWGDL